MTAQAEIQLEAAPGAEGTSPLPRFRMVAYTGAAMRVAGWRAPVVIDLAGLAIPSPSRPIRFSHDASAGVGHTDTIQVESGQLIATGVISRDTSAAREIVASDRNGFPWQASVGASVDEFEFIKPQQTVIVNGQEHHGPVNVVRKATLSEISFVDLGADALTQATIAAHHAPDSLSEEEPNEMPTDTTPESAQAPPTPTAVPETDRLPPEQVTPGDIALFPCLQRRGKLLFDFQEGLA